MVDFNDQTHIETGDARNTKKQSILQTFNSREQKFLYVADWSTVTPEASRYSDLGKGTRYCDERVCLSVSQFVCVCLRVCMRAYLRNYSSIFTHVYRGSVLHWRRCDTLCTSVSVDGVICLHIMARDM